MNIRVLPIWAVLALGLSGMSVAVGDAVASTTPRAVNAVVSLVPGGLVKQTGLSYFPVEQRLSREVVGVPLSYGTLPLVVNPAVERHIEYFQTELAERVQEWLDRFYAYQPLVERIFAELGLPRELVYLSLVESGFNPRAYSRARASGPWQFIVSTGRMYGLKFNWYVDERRDPIKSTVAAARHLRDLYDRFGSWPLAMAAYNAGAGKISRAMRKARTNDFGKIARTRYIRRETKQYLPKFVALSMIAMDPARFGFHPTVVEPHQYEEAHIGKPVRLRAMSKEADISFDELHRLNPELRRSVIPSRKTGYYLKVPVGMSAHVESVASRMKEWVPPPQQTTWYRVRRGDSLSVLALRFGMSVGKLKRLNRLSGSLIRVGQRLRVGEEGLASGDAVRWYRVRRGDSLWGIAKRFRVSVRDLKAMNNLRGNMIRTRQLLMLSP